MSIAFGVVLFARNIAGPERTAALVAAIREDNPRAVVAIDEEASFEALVALFAEAGHSRLPLTGDGLDDQVRSAVLLDVREDRLLIG